MRETIQDMAQNLFFDICDQKPTDVDVFFLEQIYFPKIEYEPRTTIYFPVPKKTEGIQTLHGNSFSNIETSQETVFALFFASICHAAGHAKITDFKKYKSWMKGKDKRRAYEVFEFIEDIRVNEFLKNNYPEYFSEIVKIKEFFNTIREKKENIKEYSRKIFAERFVENINKQKEVLIKEIRNTDSKDDKKIIQIADAIYNLVNIRNEQKFSFEDHIEHPKKIETWNENIKINTNGEFQKLTQRFGDIWFEQLKRRTKLQKKYGKVSEGLEFDKIDFAPENIGEYLRLKNSTQLFLKKLSSQIKQTPNAVEEGNPEDMGLVELQAAIQSIAAQNPSMQIFEQDDVLRVEEEWAILLDTSSSMRLKFDEMKKFAICLGEAANQVNSRDGKWGFYTFNNNFTIIKDHYEKFDQHARSRIGGIEINGLSFIADAVKLCGNILEKENVERKYIFLITDGQALGTVAADEKMLEAIEAARKKGISVVGIGAQQQNTKIYSMCMPYEGLRKTIAKFLGAYTILAEDGI